MARLTEGWGRRVHEERTAEAACANRPGLRGERLAQRRLPEVAPITTQANISTDGAMLLVRTEGWKEVKVVALSAVQDATRQRPVGHSSPAGGTPTPLVALTQHSYQAGLWDADTMAEHQYAEGLPARPGLLPQTQFGQRRRLVDQAYHRYQLPGRTPNRGLVARHRASLGRR